MHAELHCLTPLHRSIGDSEPEPLRRAVSVRCRGPAHKRWKAAQTKAPRKRRLNGDKCFDIASPPGLLALTQTFPALRLLRISAHSKVVEQRQRNARQARHSLAQPEAEGETLG